MEANLNILAFYGFAGLAVFAALLILFSKNIMHAVFMLVLVFLGIAGIFIITNAEFVGVTQIMVYVGGILILMMFGVMMTNRIDGGKLLTENRQVIPAVAIGAGMTAIFYGAFKVRFPSFYVTAFNDSKMPVTEKIGINLMTDQLVALELTGVLLLMALVGAALLAGLHLKTKEKK